jgi:hypothetical protein
MNQNFAIKQFLDLENYDDLICFYEKRLEKTSENYSDLLISVLDEITVVFVENNQIYFTILVYQKLRAIALKIIKVI